MKEAKSLLVAVLVLWPLFASFAQSPKAPETADSNSIDFDSVEEALRVLKAKQGVTFRTQDGWTVAEDTIAIVAWLITPPGHPAYPSIVKRGIVNKPDGAHMETIVRCLAAKDVCDKYFGAK